MVYIPDDSDFSSFRDQCESLEGWHCRYNKAGVTVWSQGQEESCTVQKIKVSRRLQLQDRQPFPAPAVCPAAPKGPWGAGLSWGCTAPWSHLPGGVSVLELAELVPQRCFPSWQAALQALSACPVALASRPAGMPAAASCHACMHVGSCCSCP